MRLQAFTWVQPCRKKKKKINNKRSCGPKSRFDGRCGSTSFFFFSICYTAFYASFFIISFSLYIYGLRHSVCPAKKSVELFFSVFFFSFPLVRPKKHTHKKKKQKKKKTALQKKRKIKSTTHTQIRKQMKAKQGKYLHLTLFR